MTDIKYRRKQRILWDSDNTTPDGKSSTTILLEWLQTPGNYNRWRDGKAQFGETREMLCTEINQLMQKHGITHRDNANIRTRISELEHGYEDAVKWLKQNGYNDGQLPESKPRDEDTTVGANRGPDFHVLRLCRHFRTLSSIMRQQPCVVRRPYNRVAKESTLQVSEPDPSPNESNVTTSSLSSLTRGNKMNREEIVHPLSTSRDIAKDGNGGVPTSTLTFEQTQRMLADAAHEERENKRFKMDEERHRLHCEKLRYQVALNKLELAVHRVLAQKKLVDAGVSTTTVDTILKSLENV